MPIGKDEWEKGYALSEWEKQIIDFLKANRNNAFTFEEIIRGTNFSMDYSNFWGAILAAIGFSLILEGLVKRKEIRKKTIESTDYYIIG